MYGCSICGEEIFTSNPRKYFCRRCWGEWHDAILAKEPWVTYCVNHEHQQRRQAMNDEELIYLGNEFEVGEFGDEYRLAPTEEHFEEWDNMARRCRL